MIAEADTLWTGLSGLILFLLVLWAAIHFLRK
jgi:hypothetical protein